MTVAAASCVEAGMLATFAMLQGQWRRVVSGRAGRTLLVSAMKRGLADRRLALQDALQCEENRRCRTICGR